MVESGVSPACFYIIAMFAHFHNKNRDLLHIVLKQVVPARGSAEAIFIFLVIIDIGWSLWWFARFRHWENGWSKRFARLEMDLYPGYVHKVDSNWYNRLMLWHT